MANEAGVPLPPPTATPEPASPHKVKTMPKGAKLNMYVHLRNEDGEVKMFGPEDEVPDWARALIQNHKLWADPEDLEEPVVQTEHPFTHMGKDQLHEQSRDALAAYAEEVKGISVSSHDTKQDIVDAIVAR